MLDEKQIIEKLKKRDPKVQKKLFDVYSPIMLGICLRYVYEKSEAEDILQDAFLKILTRIDDYLHKGSFEGWMKRIVINTAITHYHRNGKYHKNHHEIEDFKESKMTEYSINGAEFNQEELLGVIKGLPDGYRMVFNLFGIEGYKHKEIAEMLNINENTSKSQYSRARQLIQKRLKNLKREANKIPD